MKQKIQVALNDGTWLEGIRGDECDKGIYLSNAHRSQTGTVKQQRYRQLPIAKLAFVPYSNILFIVIEE